MKSTILALSIAAFASSVLADVAVFVREDMVRGQSEKDVKQCSYNFKGKHIYTRIPLMDKCPSTFEPM